ncbi:MAG: FeoA family protein, partial [Chitinophagaceae bacterium]
ISLAHLPPHQPATVVRVSNQSEEMLELLQHKHIAIGSVLEVKKLFAFDQSLQLRIQPQRIETISEQLAKNIFVTYETGKQ